MDTDGAKHEEYPQYVATTKRLKMGLETSFYSLLLEEPPAGTAIS